MRDSALAAISKADRVHGRKLPRRAFGFEALADRGDQGVGNGMPASRASDQQCVAGLDDRGGFVARNNAWQDWLSGLLGLEAGDAENAAHSRYGEIGVKQNARLIRESKDFGEMNERTRALLPANHPEMTLVAVEICEKYNPGFIKSRWRFEDVTRQRHGRREDIVIFVDAPASESGERGRGCRCDRVENPEEGVGMALFIAGDQLGIVEIVACIHAYAGRKPPAHCNLLLLLEERNFDAVDLVGVVTEDAETNIHRRAVIERAPIARQCRIEHFAKPMDDHWLLRRA